MPHVAVEDACPGDDDIAAFLRGCLVPDSMRALEAHVGRCATCRRLLSALARAAAMESRRAADSVSPTLPMESGASETELPLGARFGRYVVLDWIGAGGMGVVYAAYDPELNRKVALKVLRNDGAGPADRLPIHDSLLREAQAMAQLAHPNVVTVFDVGSVDDRVFIAMELVEGLTLAQWLIADRRERSEIIATFQAAGNGLAAAHAAGLIHRDFKPDNVLIGNDGRVRVTDFGLARAVPREPLEAPHRRTVEPRRGVSTTQTGLVGTLAYMAPEQYFGRSADARADQFSFAVALYEALHGERPLAPLQFALADRAVSHHAVATPRGGVPVALRQVLLRALSPEPDKRYPSMRELLAALAPRPRRGLMITVGAIVMVAMAVTAAGAYAIHLRHAAEQRTELVSRLRGLVPEIRTQLRSAHMLPLHNIRPAREIVRSAMRDVERLLQTPAGRDEIALVDFVLGEGHRALGDRERGLALLEAAWAAGARGPHIDAALGAALGAVYERRLTEIEHTVQSSHREGPIHRIEQRYRDPAMVHLRAASVARDSSPAYLEALISFHDHRFADSSSRAHAAFTEAPTLYEAGVLEAKAHNEAARELLAADRGGEANTEFAAARRVFEHVLEIARSDDDVWLAYGEMVYSQAHALAPGGELPADLRQQAITALRTVRQINPGRWEALLSEAKIYEYEANIAVIGYRDPGPHVDQVLALANEARAHGADADRVDAVVCDAYWERAVYQGRHGIDPHPAFEQAVAACERAAAARPDAGKYDALGTVYSSRASYDAEHGGDPMAGFELGVRNHRMALGIDDNAGVHYNLGRTWTKLAHYHSSHGRDPQEAVDAALAELEATLRMTARRYDAWAGISDALIARARFQLAAHDDAQPALIQAHRALERALAIEPALAPRYRIMLAELDAELLLDRDADPTAAVERMRADVQLLLRRLPGVGFAHRLSCQAELMAARWALARRQPVDPMLTRAASEAAQARRADPADALAWTASAEVELLRAEAARGHGSARGAAIASGLAFIEQAMKIDPGLVRAQKARDELTR